MKIIKRDDIDRLCMETKLNAINTVTEAFKDDIDKLTDARTNILFIVEDFNKAAYKEFDNCKSDHELKQVERSVGSLYLTMLNKISIITIEASKIRNPISYTSLG